MYPLTSSYVSAGPDGTDYGFQLVLNNKYYFVENT